jgi:putative inorganic carbon (HCO3(-)) transporter
MSKRELIAILALTAGAGLILWGHGPALAGVGAALYLLGAAARPLAGLGGVVASLPLYLYPRQVGGLAFSLPEAAVLLCALAIGLRAAADRRRGRSSAPFWRPTPFDGPIALLLAAALLSLLVTEYLRLSLRELRTLIVEPVLFFYLVRHTVGTPEDATRLLDVLLVAATAVALVGIGQFFLGGAVTEVQGVRRIQGTYSSPNHLGLLLGRAVPFLLAGAWLGVGRRWKAPAAAVCLAALGLTFSLGGWLGTAAAVLALALALERRRAILLAVVLPALGLLAVAALPAERILARLDPAQGTTFVRLRLWEASLAMLAEQPLLGIGLDNFLYRYTSYVPAGVVMEPNLSHPHNLVLHFWLQLGLAGLAALVWLLGVFLARTLPRLSPATPRRERALAVGALASMTDFVVHGSIDNSYFLVDTAFIFWLTLAVGVGGRVQSPSPHRSAEERPAGRAPTSTLLDGGSA